MEHALRIEELPPRALHAALARFVDEPYLALLESAGELRAQARYSFLCFDPFLVFTCKRGTGRVGPPGALREVAGRPLAVLRELLTAHAATPDEETNLPFLGGAVGYLGFELLHELEEVPDTGRDDEPIADASLAFHRSVLVTDRLERRSFLASNGFGSTRREARARADKAFAFALRRLAGEDETSAHTPRLEALLAARRAAWPRLDEGALQDAGITPLIAREDYLRLVEASREGIASGALFELCLSNRFDVAAVDYKGVELYDALRLASPAPFGAYLRTPEVEVASSSPERFLSLRDGLVETRPIKGTRPRGATREEDEALVGELLRSEKDRAENLMIVDLSRNDLGRVCAFGSVRATSLLEVESFAFTHQLVSTVEGRLRVGRSAIDLLAAAFPGGSIVGAPKIEAMKWIDRLEPVKRGIFSGSIGYLGFDGALDLNIAIRTLVRKPRSLSFHTGGAIVTDSDPAEEHQELLDKASGLVLALELARSVRNG